MNPYILNKDLLEWLTGCDPASPKIAVSEESDSCSVCWDSKEVGSNISEGVPQQQDDELSSMSEGKQAKSKAFFFHALLCRLPQEFVAVIRGAPSSFKSAKSSQEWPGTWILVNSRCSQFRNQIAIILPKS